MKFTFTFSKRVYLLLSFVATLLTIGVSHTKADELTIYDNGDLSAGSTYSVIIPMSGNNADFTQKCEFIVPENKLVDLKGKTITGLTFYTYEDKTTNFTGKFRIFLKETANLEKSSFEGDENASVVFEGNLTISSNQLKIDFTDEFAYNGGNLLVGFYQTKSGNYSSYNFIGETLDYNCTYKATTKATWSTDNVASGFIPKTTFTYSSVQKPKMKVNMTSFDFGFVKYATETSVKISNKGNGELTNINITSDNDAYTFDNIPTSLAAGAEQEVKIMLSTRKYDVQNATITISADEFEGEKAAKINLSAIVVNPDKFYIDFRTDNMPSDWVNQDDQFEFNTGDNGYMYTSEALSLLTMSKLVVNEGDKFYFTAKSPGYYGTQLAVYYKTSIDGPWVSTPLISISLEDFDQEEYKLYIIENAPAGDIYLGFNGKYVYIQQMYGYSNPVPAAIELDETVAPEGLTTGTQDVNLKYTIKEGKWNTIALPFAVNDLSVFGTDVKAYAFTGYENNEIKFNKVESLEAGKPYVMYVGTAAEANGNFTFESVEITATEASESAFNGAALKATYAPIAKGSMTETWYGITPDGKIMKAGANASIKGFRAYMTLPENTDASSLKMMFDGDATGIYVIENNTKNNDAIYNINGQRVSNATKGIYIINGKKVIK